MISMSVGCFRAYHKVILINEHDPHRSASANFRLPRICCHSADPKNSAQAERSEVCTYLTDTHSLPPPLPSSLASVSWLNRCTRPCCFTSRWQFSPTCDTQKRDAWSLVRKWDRSYRIITRDKKNRKNQKCRFYLEKPTETELSFKQEQSHHFTHTLSTYESHRHIDTLIAVFCGLGIVICSLPGAICCFAVLG